jgi:hypothetical protein
MLPNASALGDSVLAVGTVGDSGRLIAAGRYGYLRGYRYDTADQDYLPALVVWRNRLAR